jgi:hypothetical protein
VASQEKKNRSRTVSFCLLDVRLHLGYIVSSCSCLFRPVPYVYKEFSTAHDLFSSTTTTFLPSHQNGPYLLTALPLHCTYEHLRSSCELVSDLNVALAFSLVVHSLCRRGSKSGTLLAFRSPTLSFPLVPFIPRRHFLAYES